MIHTGSAQPTWEDHGRKQQSCPWARPQWPRERSSLICIPPFLEGGVGVGVRPRGACSLPEPAHPSGKCSNRPKTRNASQPASANLALNRGQTKQSPEDKCLCPQGCPARAAEKPPRTEGSQSAQHLGAQMPESDFGFDPCGVTFQLCHSGRAPQPPRDTEP